MLNRDLNSNIAIKLDISKAKDVYDRLEKLGYAIPRDWKTWMGASYIWVNGVTQIVSYSTSNKIWYPDYEMMTTEVFLSRMGYKRILKLDDDPWGEENWDDDANLVDEKLKYRFHIGEKVRLKRNLKKEIGGKPVFAISNVGGNIGVIQDINDEDNYAYKIKWNNGFVDRYSEREIVPVLKSYPVLKIGHEDPWGEDVWGYVQESKN